MMRIRVWQIWHGLEGFIFPEVRMLEAVSLSDMQDSGIDHMLKLSS